MGLSDSLKKLQQKLAGKLAAERESLNSPDSMDAPAARPREHRIGLADVDVASAGFPTELRNSDGSND
jgi:hypothetical protein